jgi:hypothetical protein
MMGRSATAVLLLHAAAAFQFHENKCEPKTSLPTSEDSKRIAFILRGDAYRGLSYGSTARGSKRGFMCTPFAVRIQRAISQSHVDYIIAPLEAAGFRVDVFFATYGCVENAEAQLERLKGFYDRNATRVVHVDRVPRPGATQATPANIAMKSLRRMWPKEGYRSVLIWRFDLVATTPMGSKMTKLRPAGNTARCDPQLDKDGLARPARDFRCWCMPLTVSCDSPAGYDAYVSHGDIAYLKYEDDWAFGFPGKLARCAVPVFESDALAMRTFIASHETNYRLAKTGPVLTVFPKRWGIYRTDYSPQGPDKLCRLLRDKFDGPPCPATAELGAKMACLRHARAANASTVKEARKATPSWFWQRAACDNATEFIDRRLRGGFVHGHRRRPHHHSPP